MSGITTVIEGRCFCARCEASGQNVYRMVGACTNCGLENILFIFRAGDPSTARDCPDCGGRNTAHPRRRATADEIPAAAEGGVS